jgi:type I restriction enzyme S subunit
MSDLPKNWGYGKLSQTAHVVRGITFPAGEKRNDLAQGYVCCLRTTNVQQKLEWDDVYYVPTSYVKRDEQLVREGDVLMSMANSYELVGKVARAINVPQPAAFGAFLAAVRPTHAIDGGYLYHFLRSSEVQSKLREGSSQTTNIANISVGRLSELPVPLAPWSEQKRIADKLDTVLTRVDAVNTRLARVAPILKRFRQSVLAAATSGRLTLDQVSQDGNASWPNAQLGEICSKVTDGEHTTPKRSAFGKYLLSARNVRDGSIALENVDFVEQAEFDRLRLRCNPSLGDVLLSCSGSVGRAALVDLDDAYVMVRSAALIRPDREKLIPKFLMYALQSPQLQQQILEASRSTAQANIFLGPIKRLNIALPSLAEQAEIVRRVETLFAFADRLEARLQAAQNAADRLTPALLAKAFRGELVPQDPNDEPASELLKRLAAQVAPAPQRKRRAASAV